MFFQRIHVSAFRKGFVEIEQGRGDAVPGRKLNGINPEAYLRHVLTVIADHPINRVAELLPWNLRDGLASDIRQYD